MHLLRPIFLLALTGILLASVSSRAQASTVSIAGSDIQVVAAPGETNVVTLSNGNGNSYVVTDTAGATAGAGCTAQTATSVSCNPNALERIRVTLGDGHDTLSGTTLGARVEGLGGTGNDKLTGGFLGDMLNGEGGDDTVDGGPFVYLVSDFQFADLLRGGDGVDTVTYASRSTPVRVDVDGGYDDGAAGEFDNVSTDIERVFGGSDNDVLLGSDGANEFHGGGGDDVVDGRDGNDLLYGDGGNDTIDGRYGNDTVDGGAGADSITSRDSTVADTVTCGADADSIVADREDALTACETVDLPALPKVEPKTDTTPTPQPTPTATPGADEPQVEPSIPGVLAPPSVSIVQKSAVVSVATPVLAVTLSCGLEQARDCAGTMKVTVRVPRAPGKATISRRGRKMKTVALGSSKFRIKRGKSKVVKAKMSRRGVTQALKTAKPSQTAKGPSKRIKARMTVSMRSKDGSTTTVSRPFTIDVEQGG